MTETTSPESGVDTKSSAPQNAGLAGLKLAQLQALASQLGITGGSRMRKSALVDAISEHQRGGSVAKKSAPQAAKAAASDASAPQADAKADSGEAASEEPQKKRTRSRAAAKTEKPAESGTQGEQQSPKQAAPAEDSAAAEDAAPRSRGRRGSRKASQPAGEPQPQGKEEAADASAAAGESTAEKSADRSADQQEASEQEKNDGDRPERSGRNRRGRNRRGGSGDDQRGNGDASDDKRDGDKREGDKREQREDNREQRDDNDGRGGRNRRDRNNRNRRDRDRNNRNDRRRGRNRNQPDVDETELSEDDVLLPVAGILDVLENYAFLRTSGYLPGPNDVYLSLNQVKKYNLRKGDAVAGAIRAPRDGENSSGGGRQKYNALVKLTTINGKTPEENKGRVEFNKLVPLYPQERLRLETEPKKVGPRVIDLVAPIGKGQRGLIVSPPKAGKTMILQSIANSITLNNPEVHLMMVLVDERPEEVTDMQRSVKGEVIASTFDRPADDHTTVAELAIERAKRLVEMGMDVVVLLDSMTRLGRAYNLSAPASGRILSGGVDSSALYPPKRFFGAARNIENGGSLTILATALVETGSKMDEVIFEEFKGTGNMELRLSRQLADKRIFPAVDVNASGTRREENLLSADEVRIMWRLRRLLSGFETQQALEVLTTKIKETQSNAEFLMTVSKTTLGSKNDN
ncbi:transcription termination factor Rho [Zhihengliuella flava]|uniref:Transcription termination factor Rho n=1 Tax=Zhihengliuella flava TaxID=1285193 RepID=A0A931GKM5_9MICC|nr:transcription termination factor Rho [Zhihengliuella flava]